MATIDLLKKRAVALSGAPAPGDARGTSRIVSDLCDHVGTLQTAVTELIKQIRVLEAEIAELKGTPPHTDEPSEEPR